MSVINTEIKPFNASAYKAGKFIEVSDADVKQIIIAAGDGAKAALGAFDYLIRISAPVV